MDNKKAPLVLINGRKPVLPDDNKRIDKYFNHGLVYLALIVIGLIAYLIFSIMDKAG